MRQNDICNRTPFARDSHVRAALQVDVSESLLLHLPDSISIDMSKWSGHFGTLMPFYRACERNGGFIGKSQRCFSTPQQLPGGNDDVKDTGNGAGTVRGHGAEDSVGVELDELGLYQAPVRADGEVVDWAAPIRYYLLTYMFINICVWIFNSRIVTLHGAHEQDPLRARTLLATLLTAVP
jgi:hypothetical protein